MRNEREREGRMDREGDGVDGQREGGGWMDREREGKIEGRMSIYHPPGILCFGNGVGKTLLSLASPTSF